MGGKRQRRNHSVHVVERDASGISGYKGGAFRTLTGTGNHDLAEPFEIQHGMTTSLNSR
jgi:hypothetical protein